MRTRVVFLLLLVTLLVPAAAGAQERGQFGATLGAPAAIGFIWHVSDRLALRPEISFSHSSSETDAFSFEGGVSNDSWNVSTGVSALWYFSGSDRVRPYFSPRLAFGHSSSESSVSFGPATSNTINFSGSFGAQYSPTRKFSVFGEVGYGFSHLDGQVETPVGTTETTGWGWATRGAVGVVFYFGRS